MSHVEWREWDQDFNSACRTLEVDFSLVDKLARDAAEDTMMCVVDVLDRIESPIERKLVLALLTSDGGEYVAPPERSVCIWEGESRETKTIRHTPWVDLSRMRVDLQMPVGKYRSDIVVTFEELTPAGLVSVSVYVEADGHDFHERTKEQARHDKQRDRFYVAKGLTLLRFTGSEIHKSPAKCAVEVLHLAASKLMAECRRANEVKP